MAPTQLITLSVLYASLSVCLSLLCQ